MLYWRHIDQLRARLIIRTKFCTYPVNEVADSVVDREVGTASVPVRLEPGSNSCLDSLSHQVALPKFYGVDTHGRERGCTVQQGAGS